MQMRVMQWNVMYDEDPERIVEVIQDVDPDVVCLQELTAGYQQRYSDVGAHIAARLGYYGVHDYGRMALPNGRDADVGCGIFSRWPLERHKSLVLQAGEMVDGEVTVDDRRYTQADVMTPDGMVRFGTAHEPYHPHFFATVAKRAMTETILVELLAGGGPAVWCTDLNTTSGSQMIERILKVMKNAGPALDQPTWTTKPFYLAHRHYSGLRWRLDYIFQRGLEMRSAEIINTDVSDHLPIVAELYLPSHHRRTSVKRPRV